MGSTFEIYLYTYKFISTLYATQAIDIIMYDHLISQLNSDDLEAVVQSLKRVPYEKCCRLLEGAVHDSIAKKNGTFSHLTANIGGLIPTLKEAWENPLVKAGVKVGVGFTIIAIFRWWMGF